MLFVSATPGKYEAQNEHLRVEQVIRPTGLLDPQVEVRPIEGQIDDLIGEVNKEVANKNKVLITTLTKRMAEDLTEYMPNIKASSLLIWGENDDATPLSDAKIIEGLIPDSGLCVIKNTGHYSFCENPYQAHAIINSFIE